jgi:hypothetical protein
MKKATVVVVVLAVLAFGLSKFLPWYFQVDTGKVYSVDGIALGGTEAVTYFTDEQSVKGDASITHTYEDTTWQFSSTESRDLFAADPAKYVPAYGGYCSYGMAFDGQYSTVPEAWDIVDGRLFLAYSTDMQARWIEDQAELIANSDENWTSRHPWPCQDPLRD